MCYVDTGEARISYEAIREAMGGEPYPMNLTGEDTIAAVIAAVNQGIDSHLEACYCKELGDKYEHAVRPIINEPYLNCVVSPESLPVLLRRLCEAELAGECGEEAECLVRDILYTLGFNEYGRRRWRCRVFAEDTEGARIDLGEVLTEKATEAEAQAAAIEEAWASELDGECFPVVKCWKVDGDD
jgi:hypothetical protein